MVLDMRCDKFQRMAMSRDELRRMNKIGRRQAQAAQLTNGTAECKVSVSCQWSQKIPRWDDAASNHEFVVWHVCSLTRKIHCHRIVGFQSFPRVNDDVTTRSSVAQELASYDSSREIFKRTEKVVP